MDTKQFMDFVARKYTEEEFYGPMMLADPEALRMLCNVRPHRPPVRSTFRPFARWPVCK